MAKTRLEISCSFKDKSGQTRYANRLGNLWIDLETGKGSIELPPGVCLTNPGQGNWINVDPPREQQGPRRGGGQAPITGGDDADDNPF